MSSQFVKHAVGDLVERKDAPFIMGDVVFVFHRHGDPERPQQIVINSAAHDKLQVDWASNYIPYKMDSHGVR